jgi:hypothetical protein
MSTTGPLHPGQLTRGETLDKFCVGPGAVVPWNRKARIRIAPAQRARLKAKIGEP